LDEASLAWAAGLFDGEGCISIHTNASGKQHTLRMTMQMVHKPTIERLRDIIGSGSINKAPRSKRNRNFRTAWCYSVVCQQAVTALERLRPHLVTKATEADIALTFYDAKDSTDERIAHKGNVKALLRQAKKYHFED
jgi:hypothetical protein